MIFLPKEDSTDRELFTREFQTWAAHSFHGRDRAVLGELNWRPAQISDFSPTKTAAGNTFVTRYHGKDWGIEKVSRS